MKIQIEINDVNVTVETPCYADTFLEKNNVMNVCGKMYNVIESVCKLDENINTTEDKNQYQPVMPSKKDTMVIRPRIPNNVVDIKDLTIKEATTEQALVRCPKCGQSHVLAVNSGNHIYVMRKLYSCTGKADEFRIIAEFDSLSSQDFINMCCNQDTDRKAYFEDIQKVKIIDDKDFAVSNDTEIFCPVCCESDTFINWKNAFENPLNYFETEHLCDACGGEKLEKLIKKKKVYECDYCGLQTDYKEE